MDEYMIAYIGGDHPKSPEEGKAHQMKWMAWVKGLGAAATKPANPLMQSHMISGDGVSTDGVVMSGYTVVEAENIEAAIEMAKDCPFLDINGSVQVSKIMRMSV